MNRTAGSRLLLASVILVLLPAAIFGQAIMGTASGSGQAIVFPSPNVGLPNPTQIPVPGLPQGANPHGVSYFGSDNALVSDALNSRIFVIQISTASLLSTIPTGPYNGGGTIGVAPGLTAALASCCTADLTVISAPFNASSTITTVALPGTIAIYQTEAIVFNAAGRAFVYHTAGISALDPPYTSVAFTIPVANGNSGAIAITPDGNTLLTTDLSSGTVNIFTAPFSASSVPVPLAIPGGTTLDGIFASPDGTKVLVVSAGATQLFAISAPYSGSSTVEQIPLSAVFASHEDIGIQADGQLAILTGNASGNMHTAFVQAPFTAAGATVFDVTIPNGGRGAGSVRFLPPGLAAGLTISKSAPASVASGSNLTYTITYGNTGGANATNVIIKDPVPAGTTFVSATAGGTFSAGVVTWNIGTINAGVTGQTVSFTVTVNATSGNVDNVNYTIEGRGIAPIPGPPVSTQVGSACPTITVNPATLPGGQVGVAYSQTVTGSGGTGPYTFAVTSGSLPNGLTLASGGLLSGTPTTANTFNFTITATDSNNCTGSQAYSVTIAPAACPTITVNPASLPDGTVGVAYSQTISGSGGTGPYTFAVTLGSLPTGLTLSAAGSLSGTPTASGTFNFTIRATDANNCPGSRAYSVTIAPSGACQAPPAPSLSANPITANLGQKIVLTWNQTIASGQGSYTVQVSVNGSSFLTIGTVSANGGSTAHFNYAASSPGTYDFRVLAVPACNQSLSSASGIAHVVVSGPCPQSHVVTGVTINPAAVAPGGSFTISWDPVPSYTGDYNVFESTDGGATFHLLSTVHGTSYVGTAPSTSGVVLTFEVEVAAACVYPAFSNFVSLTVGCDPPGPVTNVSIRAFGVDPPRAPSPTEYVLVSWDAPVGGSAPTRYGVRINGDPEVLVVGTSVVLPPRGTNDPITAFVTAYACAVLVSAELYDPIGGTWSVTGNLGLPREAHSATSLADGRVLVAGGVPTLFAPPTPSSEIYDPISARWSSTGPLTTPRDLHTATLLSDSRVLVAGGFENGPLSSSELYDPAAGAWSAGASLGTARDLHTATLLTGGKVLVAGGLGPGALGSAELYDPAANAWTPTGSLAAGRYRHTATVLPNGKVLVVGGAGVSGVLASAEVYDPTSGTWSATGSLSTGREAHSATLLSNGMVLVAGGDDGSASLASAELYDPAAGTWTATGSLTEARRGHTATLLSNGKVVLAGGFDTSADHSVKTAELYDPATGVFTPTGSLNGAHGIQTANLLASGRVLAAGAPDVLGTEKPGPTASSDTVALFLQPPVASFTISANPRAGTPVTFTDTSSPQATNWLWIFDDGTTDTRQNPDHTFAAGDHVVSLIASNGAGSSTATQTFTVAAASTSAVARATPTRTVPFEGTDPLRQRARVVLTGANASFLHVRSTASGERVLFVRFLDPGGRLAMERRLSVASGSESISDLGAYGLRGDYVIELVGADGLQPWIVQIGRPGPREIRR